MAMDPRTILAMNAATSGGGQPGVSDEILQALSHEIMRTISSPAPQAPTAPNPVGLSHLNAAAAAMNPQFAPLLLQQANAPAQNQYEAQKAAFEAAMNGRNHALQAGVGLASAGIRADSVLNKPQPNPRLQEKRYTITGDKAKSLGLDPSRGWIVRQNYDPLTGEYSQPDVVGEGFIPPAVVQGTVDNKPVFAKVDKSGASAGGATPVNGLLPPQPAGPAQDAAKARASLSTISEIKDVWRSFSKFSPAPDSEMQGRARGPAMYQGAIEWGLENMPGTTRTLVPTQDFETQSKYKAKMDNAVLRYVNAQSGKQYTIQELEKFRHLFPQITDPESVVDTKLADLRQAVLNDLGATEQQFPQIARPRGSGEYSGKSMTREQFNSLKSSEQARWTAGGGAVQ